MKNPSILVFDKNSNTVSWSSKHDSFSAEASIVGSLKSRFTLVDKVSKKSITFELRSTDTDGEDIFGWRYQSVEGGTRPCTFLLIND